MNNSNLSNFKIEGLKRKVDKEKAKVALEILKAEGIDLEAEINARYALMDDEKYASVCRPSDDIEYYNSLIRDRGYIIEIEDNDILLMKIRTRVTVDVKMELEYTTQTFGGSTNE